MNSGLNPANSIIVSAFRSALVHQWLIVGAIFFVLLLGWAVIRSLVLARQGAAHGDAQAAAAPAWREPTARTVLRIGFGVLWLLDGILQAQPQMAGGLPSEVIEPAASGSPGWVQHLVNFGGTIWSYHPVEAAAATVWIQVGIGMWLIFGARGWPSRLGGLASVAWGLVVWVFGEALGSIFGPGLTVLFGAPGAALLYVVAGALVALPERAWQTARAGRLILAGSSAFFLGMALLQAWPGRGFWQGTLHGKPGTLAGMVQSMVSTSQPHFLASLLSAFGNFTAAHGWGVNLFAVLALAALGAVFGASALRSDPRLARIGVIAGIVLCLADWVLIEDFGFFGGTGTDPNSMIPLALLFAAGCYALTPATAPEPAAAPQPAAAAAEAEAAEPAVPRAATVWERVAAVSGRTVAVLGAFGVVLVGAAPMAFASANHNADPIVAESLAGQSAPLDFPEYNFTLTSQAGRQVSLASLRGRAVLLAFLDPVCTSDCPIIAAEMRAADTLLGARAKDTELVAVVANPTYISTAFTQAFTRQEGLTQVPNWLYLTGSLSQLQKVWHEYGITVETLPAGAMAAHNDLAFVISPSGRVRDEISDDPGPGTESTQSSFAGLMADSVVQSMGASL